MGVEGPAEAPRKRDPNARFIAGDPIRGLATFAVLVAHASGFAAIAWGSVNLDLVDMFGPVGGRALVELRMTPYVFFVLSGFLIARPFVKSIVRGEPLPAIRRYARNRILRVVPLFWVIAAFTLIRHGGAGLHLDGILAIFGFAQTYAPSVDLASGLPSWTLDAEALFYIALPLCALFAAAVLGRGRPTRTRLAIVLGTLGVLILASYILRSFGPQRLTPRPYPPALLFAFAPGIALAAIEVLRAERIRAWRHGRACALFIFAAGLAMLGLNATVRHTLDADTGLRTLLALGGCAALVAAPLMWQWSGAGCSRWLDNRPLRWLGERSYSFYLVQFPVLTLIGFHKFGADGPWLSFAIMLAISLVGCVLVAAVTFALIERPAMRLKRGSTQRRDYSSPSSREYSLR